MQDRVQSGMAPARGATTMTRLRKPTHSCHGSGRACPCHGSYVTVSVTVTSTAVPSPDAGVIVTAVVLKVTLFVLTCIEGVATLIVIDITAGLPETALPVIGSMALMVRLVEYVPLATPVASTDTFIFTPDPPARPVPEVAESDTKLGAPEARAAVQFKGSSPVFDIVTG